jgi:CubicO group peptidase (beta-lactamase class C family)
LLGPLGLLAAAACAHPAARAPRPPPDPRDIPANIDAIVTDVLADTGTPSASVAAVVGGRIVYAHAYGDAQLEPKRPATPQMRYSIGSISKQFTASAILLLAEQGKLSLDDAVGKYIPGLTRGDDITIRMILSHTSGYQDYAPQDYMIPEWLVPVRADQILERWAKRPLDFDPGTKWQYSNTNYVIAGLIVEKVAGMPLPAFLAANVFGKLGMKSVTDDALLGPTDATGYFRRARGPLHVSPHMARAWMFAAGDLAMTAEDLATWDVSLMDGTILSPASQHTLETEVVLANGAGTGYALGLDVELHDGHRELRHGGEVTGFVANNVVLPDDKLAVAVLTNQDASRAAGEIANRVRDALLRATGAQDAQADDLVRAVLAGFARGAIDRRAFTANANAYFTVDAVTDYEKSLAPLGALESLEQTYANGRGGFTARAYEAKYADGKTLGVSVYETADGKLEQFLIELK